MPWSAFRFGKLNVEFRDQRVVEIVEALVDFHQQDTDRHFPEWLAVALPDWKCQCELPPGCIAISLEKLLTSEQRVSEFCDLLARLAESLANEDLLVAEKLKTLRGYLLNNELRRSPEPVVVYG